MKLLIGLIVLLYTALSAHADTTLTFRTQHNNNKHVLTYYIKEGMLRFSEDGGPRINLYDGSKQVFTSINQDSGTISRIDADIITQRVEQLNKIRLQKLQAAETKLENTIEQMTDQEQEIAVSLINQLKYPEFYGAHTLLRVTPSKQTRRVKGIECQLYDIFRQDKLIKQICMAPPQSLGMSEEDYSTLRRFYGFNYLTQTRLLIAAGKTGFSYVDYHQENMPGVAVEISAHSDRPDHANLIFESVSTKTLDASLFETQKPEKMD